MGKTTYKRLKGSQNLGQRLLLSTLSFTAIIADDIHADSAWPGLLSHEVSLLRLFEAVSDDCVVEINETDESIGIYASNLVSVPLWVEKILFMTGVSRSFGYFLEPLTVLALFGKKSLPIRLRGITNDPKDPSVDTYRSTTIPLLKRFGVPAEGLDLKIESRGLSPEGGGEVLLSIPIVQSLTAIT